MPVHRISDTEYTELLHLILREANGDRVLRRLGAYSPAHVHWIREWSMLLGYVELSGFMFDPDSPSGFSLPSPRLSETGRAKLAELDRGTALSVVSHQTGKHLMWVPAGDE